MYKGAGVHYVFFFNIKACKYVQVDTTNKSTWKWAYYRTFKPLGLRLVALFGNNPSMWGQKHKLYVLQPSTIPSKIEPLFVSLWQAANNKKCTRTFYKPSKLCFAMNAHSHAGAWNSTLHNFRCATTEEQVCIPVERPMGDCQTWIWCTFEFKAKI